MAAAVGKLGFAAYATGGRVILLLGLLAARLGPNATHLLLVALKLLVQRPVTRWGGGQVGDKRNVLSEVCH